MFIGTLTVPYEPRRPRGEEVEFEDKIAALELNKIAPGQSIMVRDLGLDMSKFPDSRNAILKHCPALAFPKGTAGNKRITDVVGLCKLQPSYPSTKGQQCSP